MYIYDGKNAVIGMEKGKKFYMILRSNYICLTYAFSIQSVLQINVGNVNRINYWFDNKKVESMFQAAFN